MGISMICRINDLRDKEVVNIKTGRRIGCICDMDVDTCNGQIISFVVYGRLRCFGLFGREDDIIIKWCDIQVFGEDTILVNCQDQYQKPKRKNGFFSKIFQ